MKERALSGIQLLTYSLVSLTLFFVIIKTASFILIPMAWSAFLAIALIPVCVRFEKLGLPKQVAAIISIVITSAIGVFIIYIFINQFIGLLDATPAIGEKLTNYLNEVQIAVEEAFGLQITEQNFSWDVSRMINTQMISQILKSSLQTVVMLGVVPVFIFFFIYYQDFFAEFLRRLEASSARRANLWIIDASGMIKNYLIGMLLVTVIVSIMATVVFYILGVKYFLFFALFVAVFNLIPYIGVFLSSLVSVVYVMLTTDSLLYPLLTLLLLWGIQLIENNLITPLVVGTKIKLNPLAVLVAIFLGGWAWGISGIVLFIPLMGVLKIIFDRQDHLKPFGYLLGNEIPVVTAKEGIGTKLKNWWRRK